MVSVYWAMYHRELETFTALLLGVGIGFIVGKEHRYYGKRDAKGRFTAR